MKVAAILLVCAFVHGQSIELNQNGCPIDYTIEKLYPHEECSKYYQCTHGNLVERICFFELVFNVDTQACDWPHNVDCGNRIIPAVNGNENGSENGAINSNSNVNNENGNNGNGAASGNGNGDNNGSCNCECSCPGPNGNGNGSDNGDSGNGGEDNGNGNCDNGNENGDNGNGNGDNGNGNGDNGNGGSDGSCNCNPQEAPSICGTPGSDNVLVAHEDCNKFYKCAHGLPVTQDCPGNLLYNPYIGVCDWPQNVDCSDRNIPEPNENGNGNGDGGNDNGNGENGSGNGENGSGNGDNGNVNGGSNEDSSCENINSEENNNENNGDSCYCNPQEAVPICQQDGSDGIHVAHEHCTKYYRCVSGLAIPMPCPKGLLYNPFIEVCDWPHSVDCADRIIPDDSDSEEDDDSDEEKPEFICNCNPEEAPLICAGNNSNGVLVASEYCNYYYICDNGRPVLRDCPGNLLYNPYKEVCDWPQDVDCGDRVIRDRIDNGGNENSSENNIDRPCNCDPDQAEAICAAENSESTLIAHEICNKYYICNYGLPVVQKCPGNLLYNPYKEYCDWSANVDCGNRLRSNNTDECNCFPNEAPVICAREDSNGVVIAHENCHQYYKCLNRRPMVLSCFSSYLFDPLKQKCDIPENVDCGDRFRLNDNE